MGQAKAEMGPAARRRSMVVVAIAILALGALFAGSLSSRPADAAEPRRFLLGPESELLALPTSGPAWQALREAADQPLTVNLANQDDLSPSRALAAALVHVRTGETSYRDRVVTALRALPGTEVGGRTLSLGRQLAGWVLAADLVGFREPAFVSWLTGVRTSYIGGHGRWTTLTQTHEATSSNWGAFAGASRIAASLYLGDTADVARAVQVFRGWLGDRNAWPTLAVGATGQGFLPTADFDTTWACVYPSWQPVNGACGTRTGALVEDISRGDPYPNATSVGLSYSWEALQGATLQAILLGRNGYADVWTWQGSALRSSLEFLAANRGFESTNFNRVNHWVPSAIDQVYGTGFATVAPGSGRNFGFTDWLRVGPMTGTATTTTAAPSTTAAPTTAAPTTAAPSTTAAPTTTTAPKTTTTTAPPTTTTTAPTTSTTAPVDVGRTIVVTRASADTFVSSSAPNTSYGRAREIEADGSPTKVALIAFPVSGVGDGTVVRATLRLHVGDPSSDGGTVRTVLGSWSELTTWSNRPAIGTAIATVGDASRTGWVEVDVTGAVVADGMANFAISSTNPDTVGYTSGPRANAPELVIVVD